MTAVFRRSWRRFRRRPAARQWSTLVLAVVVVGGATYAIAAGSSDGGTTRPVSGQPSNVGRTAAVDQASVSSRGVTATSINVVFPVANLDSLANSQGFAGDVEGSEQTKAINLYVDEINSAGGINGRRIHPVIVPFNPINAADSRALCKDWTEGGTAAFAVVDGVGAWTGDRQLCVTQEGSTPLISAWTTVSDWTRRGSPYLWWTGPDQAAILQAVTTWGQSSGLLAKGKRVGVVVSDQADDQLALHDYLLPDLAKIGITNPVIETLAANPADAASTTSQAPLVVQHLKAAGVESLIPIIPFNALFPELQAQTQQQYFPRLLLSDYGSSIVTALGLIPVPYLKALDGQDGLTTLTLGAVDDPRPESQGGYNQQTRNCNATWTAAYPGTPPGKLTPYIEAQGPDAGWCQAIRLFAVAAAKAGPVLNRRTFVQAMAGIKSFPATWYPSLSFGVAKPYGPSEYQVVRLHNNDPHHDACPLTSQNIPQGTCWQPVQGWQPLPPP